MKRIQSHLLLILLSCLFSPDSFAQTDPEFPPGFVMHVKLHNGMITNFHRGADLYVGGLQLIPQFTIIPQRLRAGIIAGGFFAGKTVEGQFGPTLSLKLKTFNAGPFGSAANLHLSGDHIWGTGKQKLAGAGLHVDLLNKLVLGFTAHRDYEFNTWWLQTALGLRINKIKKTTEPFNQ